MKHYLGRLLTGAAVLAALVACAPTGGQGPYAPSGIVRGQVAVDGLTVGHRLMAAGEYHLALDAYIRAAGDQGLTVDVLSAIGSANFRLGRLGQAEQMLRRAIATDETFVPAWNNLGVVLMEQRRYAEAERIFQTAFAIDSGATVAIRDNLNLAIANGANPIYGQDNNTNFSLIRRGSGEYLLLSTP